ncbi:hypothetical protein ACERNI_09475 [Camelimonas sp. ID_303_24]
MSASQYAAMAGRLFAFLDGKVARDPQPRTIVFMDALPRLPIGKFYRRALCNQYLGDNKFS